MIRALRMVQRNGLVYKRTWRGSVFLNFLQPSLFLLAMGVGVGALVDRSGPSQLGGLDFLNFLAPGLLAASCMQAAAFESSYPIAGKMTWFRNYEAIRATPMRIKDLVIGELFWMALRLSTVAIGFTVVITVAGVPRSTLVIAAIPAAVLTGLAFSAPIMAYAATSKTGADFNNIFRFVITPLFLFSGVFFPVSRLPEALQFVAWFTPLFHGVELVRGLTLGTIESPIWAVHIAYLLGVIGIGYAVALRTFRRKLDA
jgi:lipooligosaccharide transport system permease protein